MAQYNQSIREFIAKRIDGEIVRRKSQIDTLRAVDRWVVPFLEQVTAAYPPSDDANQWLSELFYQIGDAITDYSFTLRKEHEVVEAAKDEP